MTGHGVLPETRLGHQTTCQGSKRMFSLEGSGHERRLLEHTPARCWPLKPDHLPGCCHLDGSPPGAKPVQQSMNKAATPFETPSTELMICSMDADFVLAVPSEATQSTS